VRLWLRHVDTCPEERDGGGAADADVEMPARNLSSFVSRGKEEGAHVGVAGVFSQGGGVVPLPRDGDTLVMFKHLSLVAGRRAEMKGLQTRAQPEVMEVQVAKKEHARPWQSGDAPHDQPEDVKFDRLRQQQPQQQQRSDVSEKAVAKVLRGRRLAAPRVVQHHANAIAPGHRENEHVRNRECARLTRHSSRERDPERARAMLGSISRPAWRHAGLAARGAAKVYLKKRQARATWPSSAKRPPWNYDTNCGGLSREECSGAAQGGRGERKDSEAVCDVRASHSHSPSTQACAARGVEELHALAQRAARRFAHDAAAVRPAACELSEQHGRGLAQRCGGEESSGRAAAGDQAVVGGVAWWLQFAEHSHSGGAGRGDDRAQVAAAEVERREGREEKEEREGQGERWERGPEIGGRNDGIQRERMMQQRWEGERGEYATIMGELDEASMVNGEGTYDLLPVPLPRQSPTIHATGEVLRRCVEEGRSTGISREVSAAPSAAQTLAPCASLRSPANSSARTHDCSIPGQTIAAGATAAIVAAAVGGTAVSRGNVSGIPGVEGGVRANGISAPSPLITFANTTRFRCPSFSPFCYAFLERPKISLVRRCPGVFALTLCVWVLACGWGGVLACLVVVGANFLSDLRMMWMMSSGTLRRATAPGNGRVGWCVCVCAGSGHVATAYGYVGL
jgi:hypothetical protein